MNDDSSGEKENKDMADDPNVTRGAVIATAKWTVEMIRYESGETVMERTNDGFTIWELMGIVELVKDDLIKQHARAVKQDEVKRIYVKP